MEFGGFIGGFGKNFFTKGGIKREKSGFIERGKEPENLWESIFGLCMERNNILNI